MGRYHPPFHRDLPPAAAAYLLLVTKFIYNRYVENNNLVLRKMKLVNFVIFIILHVLAGWRGIVVVIIIVLPPATVLRRRPGSFRVRACKPFCSVYKSFISSLPFTNPSWVYMPEPDQSC